MASSNPENSAPPSRLQGIKYKSSSPRLAIALIPTIGATLFLFLAVSYVNQFLAGSDEPEVTVRTVEGVVGIPSALEQTPPPPPMTAEEYLRMHGRADRGPEPQLEPYSGRTPRPASLRLEPVPSDLTRVPSGLQPRPVEEALRSSIAP